MIVILTYSDSSLLQKIVEYTYEEILVKSLNLTKATLPEPIFLERNSLTIVAPNNFIDNNSILSSSQIGSTESITKSLSQRNYFTSSKT